MIRSTNVLQSKIIELCSHLYRYNDRILLKMQLDLIEGANSNAIVENDIQFL
jgi:hypothetical protein